MPALRWAGRLDMYRKVPVDLMEGTKRGSTLSLIAVAGMLTLFLLETSAYFRARVVTDLVLDRNRDPKVRINFNITMMDLKCEYVVVDVVSVLGTEQNVSSHVTKWHVDGAGVRQRYQGRNKEQHDIAMYDPAVQESMEDLLKDGEDAVSLDPETFRYALKTYQYLFVDWYASWCSHCRDLAPTWEILAELMVDVAEDILDAKGHDYSEEEYAHARKVEQPVVVAKIDCVIHQELCMEQQIMAYPTLRLFVDGKRWKGGDYRGSRTLVEMTDWLQQVEDAHKADEGSEANRTSLLAHKAAKEYTGVSVADDEASQWADKVRRQKQRVHHSWVDTEHPGCQLVGHLLADRVPGHFSIMARSPHHEIEPKSANVSHFVHSLTVGEPVGMAMIEKGSVQVSDTIKKKLSPMNGYAYVNEELHEAYHHYLKVITTNIEGLKYGMKDLNAYQILESSQLSYYRNDMAPEAKFIIDLSPIAVSYRTTRRHWYDYVTSVMAIIGGTFTVVGMLESSIAVAVARRKRYSLK